MKFKGSLARVVELVVLTIALLAPQSVVAIGRRTLQDSREPRNLGSSQSNSSSPGNSPSEAKLTWEETEKFLTENDVPLNVGGYPPVLLTKGESDQFCSRGDGDGFYQTVNCNFITEGKPVVVSHKDGPISPSRPLVYSYSNVSYLYLADTCHTVELNNVTLGFFRPKTPFCDSALSFRNCQMTAAVKGRLVHLYASHSNFTDLVVQTDKFEFFNSSVGRLEITGEPLVSSVPFSRRRSYHVGPLPVMTLQDSKINVFTAISDGFIRILNSTIDFIPENGLQIFLHQGRFVMSLIQRSNLGLVMSGGINLTQAHVSLENVDIDEANKGAFVIKQRSRMQLRNVTFVKGVPGMFEVEHTSDLMFSNVTVGGLNVDSTSEFVHYHIKKREVFVNLTVNTKDCRVSSQTAVCDFREEKNDVSVHSHDDLPGLRISLLNAADLTAIVTCPTSVSATNVTGSLLAYNRCPRPAQFTVSGSSLKDLTVYSSSVLTLRQTEIQAADLSGVAQMDVSDCKFHVVTFSISGPGSAKQSLWKNVNIHSLNSFYTEKPVVMENIRIAEQSGMIFDHLQHTSVIRNMTIGRAQGVIVVKAGTLQIEGLHYEHIYRNIDGTFIVKEGAQISLKDITMDELPLSGVLLMADTENQVVFEDNATLSLFDDRIVIVHTDQYFPYRVWLPASECNRTHVYDPVELDIYADIVCDYALLNQSDVLMGHLASDSYDRRVAVKNARSLTIRDVCFERIILVNISSVDMREQALKCETRFEVRLVNISGIYDEFRSFSGVNFTTPYLISGSVYSDFVIRYANVEAILAVHGRNILIENSMITNITRLTATETVNISNSRIAWISSKAIKVGKNSKATLTNLDISTLYYHSLDNAGSLHIVNTTVMHMASNCTILRSGSVTKFTNVFIANAADDPFMYEPGATLIFENVWLNEIHNLTITHDLKITGSDFDGKVTFSVGIPFYQPQEEEHSAAEVSIKSFMSSILTENSTKFQSHVNKMKDYHSNFLDSRISKALVDDVSSSIASAWSKKNNESGSSMGLQDLELDTQFEARKDHFKDGHSWLRASKMEASDLEEPGVPEITTKTHPAPTEYVASEMTNETYPGPTMHVVSETRTVEHPASSTAPSLLGYTRVQAGAIAVACSVVTMLLAFCVIFARQIWGQVRQFAYRVLPRPSGVEEPFEARDQLSEMIDNRRKQAEQLQ